MDHVQKLSTKIHGPKLNTSKTWTPNPTAKQPHNISETMG